MLELDTIIQGDCLEVMQGIEDNSVDLVLTDPPYGYSFMGKDWDRVVIGVDYWKECYRVLKDGAFAFIMSAPRQDVLSRMIVNLQDAGFETGFTSIYWTYASGFPKASNISKMVDKRFRRDYVLMAVELGFMPKSKSSIYDWTVGEHSPSEKYWEEFKSYLTEDQWRQVESKVIATTNQTFGYQGNGHGERWNKGHKITIPSTPEAKALDGSYGGFQPKPAVEVVLVVMKPLAEKTFVDQALANGHGITWLDDGRISYKSDDDKYEQTNKEGFTGWENEPTNGKLGNFSHQGRFPANLLCSDDMLNDGVERKSGDAKVGSGSHKKTFNDRYAESAIYSCYADSGSFSRYFSLDSWWDERIKLLPESVQKTFPFIIVPKASKSEKNKGCEDLPEQNMRYQDNRGNSLECFEMEGSGRKTKTVGSNHHPTVKPLKLFSYLITLGSREGDLVLDPFVGSGTSCISAKILNRHWIGIEQESEYVDIATKRIEAEQAQLTMVI